MSNILKWTLCFSCIACFCMCTTNNNNKGEKSNSHTLIRSDRKKFPENKSNEIKKIQKTKKKLYNGEDFWYAGTYYEIDNNSFNYCRNYEDEENNFIFFSAGCIDECIAVLDINDQRYCFSENCPNKWIQEASTTKNTWATTTFFCGTDQWIITYADGSFKQKGCPQALLECLMDKDSEDAVMSVSFNKAGNWFVKTSKDEIFADDETLEFIKRAKKRLPEANLRYFSVKGNSKVATSFNGIYFENIPSNLANKIKLVKYATVDVSFNSIGEYFMTQNGSDYFDACLTPRHLAEMKNNLSSFHMNEISSDSPSSPSSNNVSRAKAPDPCYLCYGTRRCNSCVKGRYYAHGRYHECGVCRGTGVCTGCNGTGIQPY